MKWGLVHCTELLLMLALSRQKEGELKGEWKVKKKKEKKGESFTCSAEEHSRSFHCITCCTVQSSIMQSLSHSTTSPAVCTSTHTLTYTTKLSHMYLKFHPFSQSTTPAEWVPCCYGNHIPTAEGLRELKDGVKWESWVEEWECEIWIKGVGRMAGRWSEALTGGGHEKKKTGRKKTENSLVSKTG